MMPTGTDPTHICKITNSPISPRQALKLGPSAAWEKFKYQTKSLSNRNNPVEATTYSNAAVNGHGHGSRFNGGYVFKFGSNGEIFVSFGNSIEVWDWTPSSLQVKQLESGGVILDEQDDLLNDGLYLVASLTDLLPNDTILDFEPIEINQSTNSYTILITLRREGEIIFVIKRIGQFFEEEEEDEPAGKYIILPPSIHGFEPFVIKASSKKFFGISTNEGSLTIFDQTNSQPLSLNLNAKMVNGNCLFDIQGRLLAYVPQESDDHNKKDMVLTNINFPSYNRSVYSRFMENLSNTAIDGFSKISKNIHNIQNSSQAELKENLKIYLSSLMNVRSSSTSKAPKVILIDLESLQQLACFQPPNGISCLSLSPFNSHLVTINSRGNQIYKWDITKIPNEIDLIDIQVRGKTSSIVKQVHWYSSNVFQIVTAQSGSIHCFFSDSTSKNWVLPNQEISLLGRMKPMTDVNITTHTLMAKSRSTNDVYLVDLSGGVNTKYQIPSTPIPKSLLPDYIPTAPVDEITFKRQQSRSKKKSKSSLSQVEIETCQLRDPLVKNKRFEFATYDFKTNGGGADDSVQYWSVYKTFGHDFTNGVNIKTMDIAGKKAHTNGDVVFQTSGEEELEHALRSVMVKEHYE